MGTEASDCASISALPYFGKMCSDVGYTISICADNNARPSVRSARVDSPGRDSQSGWNTHDDRRTNTEEVNKFTCPNSATSC